LRRTFAYSVTQPDEQRVREDVAVIIAGFPVKVLELLLSVGAWFLRRAAHATQDRSIRLRDPDRQASADPD
jgi:hypothetical protein